jgi:hypothetical protein
LEEASYDFITEDDIEALYKSSGRTGQRKVDFVVTESEATIFIDAKAVDPLPQVRNSDTPKFIFDKSKQLQKGQLANFQLVSGQFAVPSESLPID